MNGKIKVENRSWQTRLRDAFRDVIEFRAYCEIYKLHVRLGFRSAAEAWKQNPAIQGVIYPSDLRRITRLNEGVK